MAGPCHYSKSGLSEILLPPAMPHQGKICSLPQGGGDHQLVSGTINLNNQDRDWNGIVESSPSNFSKPQEGSTSAFTVSKPKSRVEEERSGKAQEGEKCIRSSNRGHNVVLPTKKPGSSYDRKLKVITECEHKNRRHYAKGMCST